SVGICSGGSCVAPRCDPLSVLSDERFVPSGFPELLADDVCLIIRVIFGFEVSERIGFGRRRTATGRRQGSRGAQKQLALEFDRLFVEIEEAAEVCFWFSLGGQRGRRVLKGRDVPRLVVSLASLENRCRMFAGAWSDG